MFSLKCLENVLIRLRHMCLMRWRRDNSLIIQLVSPEFVVFLKRSVSMFSKLGCVGWVTCAWGGW